MTSLILGMTAGVVFFLNLSVGSMEKSEPVMALMSDSEPSDGVAMVAPPPADNADADADSDGVSELAPLMKQAQVQHQQIQEQKQLTDDLLDEVNALRGALIEKRFQSLDKLARRRGWTRNRRIPKEGRRYWDEYREWLFLKENLEDVKNPFKPKLKKRPKSAAKPIQVSKKQYRPDWLME